MDFHKYSSWKLAFMLNVTSKSENETFLITRIESSRNVTSKVISNRIKQGNQNPQNNMIASFSFASTAHVTHWSNYLIQRAEILSRQSNLGRRILWMICLWCLWYQSRFRHKASLKQVGFTVSSLFFLRPACYSRPSTPNGSSFG